MKRRALEWLAVGGIAIAGLLLRLANFSSVFPGDGRVIFSGQDPYYHMRRIFMILWEYPAVPSWDGLMNFPHGATIIWPPLFDFVVATTCLAFGFGPQDVPGVETVSAFVVPVIGALSVIVLYPLAKSLLGRTEAMLAAAILAASPAHIWYSRLGFVDHHAAATLVQVAMILVFVRALSSDTVRGRVWAGGGALVVAAGLLTWNGFIAYVAVAGGSLLIIALAGERDEAPVLADLIWLAHLGAAVLILPFAAPLFSSVVLSWFHVGALAAIGLLGAALRLYHSRRFRYLGLAIPLLLGAAAVTFALTRGAVVAEGLGWMLRSDPFISRVNESLPMINIFRNDAGSLRFTVPMSLTLFYLLFPVMWIAFLARQWKHRSVESAKLILLMWSAGLFVLALMQRRFMEGFAPALAVMTAWSLMELYRRLRFRPAALSVVILVLVSYAPWYAGWRAGKNEAAVEYDRVLYETLAGFRTEVLEEGGGAINPWPLGHKILYITGLPVVANNFGSHIGEDSYRDWSEFLLSQDEDGAVAVMERRGLRYAVVDYDLESAKAAMAALGFNEGSFLSLRPAGDGRLLIVAEPALLRTMFYRMTVPQTVPGSPPLDRFRLVWEAEGDGKGRIKIWELVAGATLRIGCESGERLSFAYAFETNAGVRRSYEKNVACGEDGFAETLVPYPSDREGRGFASPYTVTGAAGVAKIFVTEDEVTAGRTIEAAWPP
jgi:dolichyl-diphosphooligosaccharide--protein glycosyltransferase